MSAPYHHPHYRHASGSRRHDAYHQGSNAAADHNRGGAYDGYATAGYYTDGGYPPEYQRDYYNAYPSEYHRDHRGGSRFDHVQGYASTWHDAYAYNRAQGYQGGWGGYDQSYHQHAYPQQYGAGYAAAQQQPKESRNGASSAAARKSVKGAPAAPKKMRDAAAASAAAAHHSDAAYPHPHSYYAPSQGYNPYPQPHFQHSRDYHTGASSRYQPYSRTPSASGTPTHPSSYRPPPPHQHPMYRLPPAIRAAPRPEYIAQAKQGSKKLTEQEAADRKLLVVLDLNGTLVFRAKRGNGRALDSVRAIPRPYLLCFLQYCLGLPESDAGKGKVIEAGGKPHGAHFWPTKLDSDSDVDGEKAEVVEPRSAGKAEVVVWSSAQPYNVDSMLRASFDDSVRSQFLRVWARDTLVPTRFFQHKAESVKDLEIVWAELNAFAHDLPSPGRLLAEVRDQQDQLRPDDARTSSAPASAPTAPKKDKAKKNNQHAKEEKAQPRPISAALEAAKTAEELGPWGASNTVLVDDSVAKARLQPWNQLVIPEFDKVEAGRMKKFILQQLPISTVEGEAETEIEVEAELEYDSDLSIGNDAAAAITAAAATEVKMDIEQEESTEAAQGQGAKKSKKKPMPESRLDDVLLQTIGVLETLRFQSNVSAFIQSGGITGYGQEKTAIEEKQRLARVAEGKTPEYWAEKGRQTCEKLGIEVKAWIPGAAASATAALL
ncbi:uncharacterized protein UTRI_03417 [Ustilago trichophora]|uniref:FCP1 homology domain-containing protein n=1 Tax=Ustilago trichophora TaxID=86804 RepID=A0A5C3E3Z1_9BASI|nr:uncharacterized protein UTRI_03417 [Ustilago trichophora]